MNGFRKNRFIFTATLVQFLVSTYSFAEGPDGSVGVAYDEVLRRNIIRDAYAYLAMESLELVPVLSRMDDDRIKATLSMRAKNLCLIYAFRGVESYEVEAKSLDHFEFGYGFAVLEEAQFTSKKELQLIGYVKPLEDLPRAEFSFREEKPDQAQKLLNLLEPGFGKKVAADIIEKLTSEDLVPHILFKKVYCTLRETTETPKDTVVRVNPLEGLAEVKPQSKFKKFRKKMAKLFRFKH